MLVLEKKLGVKGNIKKKEQLKKKYARDNFDADMIDFLEGISEEKKEGEEEKENSDEDKGDDDSEVEEGEDLGRKEEEKLEMKIGEQLEHAELDMEEQKKKIRGLFNRLSDGNIQIMFEQIRGNLKKAVLSPSQIEGIIEIIVSCFVSAAITPVQVSNALQILLFQAQKNKWLAITPLLESISLHRFSPPKYSSQEFPFILSLITYIFSIAIPCKTAECMQRAIFIDAKSEIFR